MSSESKDAAFFSIGADGIDAARIVAEIKARVAEKAARGDYRDLRIALAERANLVNLGNDEQFLKYYLECLRSAVFVDINDFEISDRRRFGGGLLVALKKIIWKLLKFYTYRMWSQQNQVNGLLVTAIECLDNKYRSRIENLERRLNEKEGGQIGKNSPH